jgi:hypothetical protein
MAQMTFSDKCKYKTSTVSSLPQILRILISHTIYVSVTASEQVSYPHKTTGKITVSYIFIFEFSDSKQENKRF